MRVYCDKHGKPLMQSVGHGGKYDAKPKGTAFAFDYDEDTNTIIRDALHNHADVCVIDRELETVVCDGKPLPVFADGPRKEAERQLDAAVAALDDPNEAIHPAVRLLLRRLSEGAGWIRQPMPHETDETP